MRFPLAGCVAPLLCVCLGGPARADTAVFFASCQVAEPVASEVTSDTVGSHGYFFTATRDKLFTGGTGEPIGRALRVLWPAGVEAQAVTTLPPGGTDHHARLTLARADGAPFDLTAITFKLLANTGGAGASLEIMPLLNGEDGLPDPVALDATGYYGQVFSYGPASTALLRGFDTYKIALYVDFAAVGLTLEGTAADPRSCCLEGPGCQDLTAASCLQQGGTPLGPGSRCSCDPCAAPAGPSPVPDGSASTAPLRASRLTASGDVLEVSWDAATCPAAAYALLHGELSNVASYAINGAACGLGISGTASWAGVPSGSLFFLMVGTDGASTESSWGRDGAGQERNGAVASGFCGITLKDPSATCP
jgi:hypothetical protein